MHADTDRTGIRTGFHGGKDGNFYPAALQLFPGEGRETRILEGRRLGHVPDSLAQRPGGAHAADAPPKAFTRMQGDEGAAGQFAYRFFPALRLWGKRLRAAAVDFLREPFRYRSPSQ